MSVLSSSICLFTSIFIVRFRMHSAKAAIGETVQDFKYISIPLKLTGKKVIEHNGDYNVRTFRYWPLTHTYSAFTNIHIVSLALEELNDSYGRPMAGEVTLKDIGKSEWYQITAKNNKAWTICILLSSAAYGTLTNAHEWITSTSIWQFAQCAFTTLNR